MVQLDTTYGVVIATYARPDELGRALLYVSRQTQLPTHVVVVDASPEPQAHETQATCSSGPNNLSIEYLRSHTPSSTVQRNEGVKALRKHNIQFVQILDDDTAPEPDYCERLIDVLLQSPNSIGASGVTRPVPPKPTLIQGLGRFFYTLVGLESYRGGTISVAGCGIPVWRSAQKVQEVEWLFGCAMWRAEVFDALEYNPVLVGAALAEDLHFSLLASRLGRLFVDPGAHLGHSYSPIERPDSAKFAYRFARNRWFVVRDMKRPYLSVPMYVMANSFLSLVALGSAIRRMDTTSYLTSWNFIKGMLDAWRNEPPR